MSTIAPPANGHVASTQDRLDAIERKLDHLLRVAEPLTTAPSALAAAADVFDEQARHASARGVDLEARLHRVLALTERLTDDKTMDALEQGLALAEQVPGLAAMVTDMADEQAQRAADRGVDLAARLQRVLALTERLTDDRTLELLETLAELAPQAPGLAAMATDMLDEQVRALEADGIDLETSVTRGLHAALRFGAEVSEREVEALQTLLRSPMLDRETVQVLSAGAQALVECQGRERGRIGMFGLVGALRDPDVQRALDFLVGVARRFGFALRDGLPTADRIHAEADAIGPARR